MTEDVERVAALLREAADLHHRYYRTTDGVDDDWATFYARWLADHSELGQVLGRRPAASELTWLLVQAARDHAAAEDWADAYARAVLQHLASTS